MEVKSELINGVTVLHISGVINTAKAQELKNDINNLLTENSKNVIMDFSKVEYISSYMVGILMEMITRAKNINGKFVITGLNETVEQILKITGIFDRLSVSDSIENALKKIS